MLTRRQRLRWWLREARLPKEPRRAARAHRWADMTQYHDDREQRIADAGLAHAKAQHSRAADLPSPDFHDKDGNVKHRNADAKRSLLCSIAALSSRNAITRSAHTPPAHGVPVRAG